MKYILSLCLLLWAISAEAATYYVGKSGSDANSCATAQSATAGNRKLTITSGVGCLSAGDTLIIGDGTYAESLQCGTNTCIVSGASSSAYTIIKSENPRLAKIQPASGSRVFNFQNSQKWIELRDLDIDGTNTTAHGIQINTGAVGPFRIQGNIVTSPLAGCLLIDTLIGSNEIIDNEFHHCGTNNPSYAPGYNALYIKSDFNLVERNYVHHVHHGIAFWNADAPASADDNIGRYNLVHDAGHDSPRGDAYCMSSHGLRNKFYNNICYRAALCVRAYSGAADNEFYNNTCHEEANDDASGTNAAIQIREGTTGTIVKNNILRNFSASIDDGGTSSVKASNICSHAVSGCTSTDPGFIDSVARDYNIIESGAAIDAGEIISGFSSGRYVGSAPDAGAFEAPIRSGASVEDGDETKYRISFSMPAQSVRDGVGLKGCTTANWAIVVAGSGATETACNFTQTTRVDLTIGAVTQGQSLTDAYTRGTLTDNVCIGGSVAGCKDAKIRTYSAQTGSNHVIDAAGDPGTTSFGGTLTIGGSAAVQ